MTSAPADLLTFHNQVMAETGLTDPSAVGVVGDGAHQRTGGYHEGIDVLEAIGAYHPPATSHVGSQAEDYSARLLRDRQGLTIHASGVDIGYRWPKGGNKAWLAFNNALVSALHRNDPALACIRAVNYSPDGSAKKRTDRETGWSVVSSSDSVDIHTHIEFYRNTEGKRGACLARLLELISQAIGGDMSVADDVAPFVNARVEAVSNMADKLVAGRSPLGAQDVALVKFLKALDGKVTNVLAAVGKPVQVTLDDATRQALVSGVVGALQGLDVDLSAAALSQVETVLHDELSKLEITVGA